MSKVKISAVSYTNTKPFIAGLENHSIKDAIDLALDVPAVCAQKFLGNQVDIGLIPVAGLANISDYEIISDFCIGANGAVDSVYLFSNCPIQEAETICFDGESKTSNNLARILLKHHWKKSGLKEVADAQAADARVLIGDKTFGRAGQFNYAYDLAEEWKKMTGLPFAFAVWVANKPISQSFTTQFNEALKKGLSYRKELAQSLPQTENFDLEDYFFNKIDYILDEDKRKAIDLYLSYLKK